MLMAEKFLQLESISPSNAVIRLTFKRQTYAIETEYPDQWRLMKRQNEGQSTYQKVFTFLENHQKSQKVRLV